MARAQIALFMTGNRHAGENLTELLKRRATGLSRPIQMCDASSRNASKEFETIVANCLAHARRQFVDIVDRFPETVLYVIEQLAKVYKNDAIVKEQGLSPEQRLEYHQQHSGPMMEELESWCKSSSMKKWSSPTPGWARRSRTCSNTGRS